MEISTVLLIFSVLYAQEYKIIWIIQQTEFASSDSIIVELPVKASQ